MAQGMKMPTTDDLMSMWQASGLKQKIIFTFLMIAAFRFGVQMPLYGINNQVFSNMQDKGKLNADGILDVFDRYNFTMSEDEPMEREVAIDPEMLGKVFENLLEINDRKSKGAFYTPREIVHYMCQESLINYLTRTLKIDEESESPSKQLGLNIRFGDPVLFNIQKNSPAASAGIREGDVVLSADARYGLSVQELVNYIRQENPIHLTLQNQDGQVRQVTVRPRLTMVDDGKGEQVERAVIGVNVGIKPDLIWLSKGPIEGLVSGWDRTVSITKTTYKAVVQMLTGEASTKNLTGPVTIADYAGKTAQMGWRVYLSFLAMISVSLGLLNLLPIPLLDGGHLLYYLVEIVSGRPLPEKVIVAGQKVGLLIVLALGALALSNDFIRLIQ